MSPLRILADVASSRLLDTGGGRGLGRPSSSEAEALSEALRRGSGSLRSRRRRLASLSLGAAACMGVVAAYQFGLVDHLLDPPLPLLDSDAVDAYQLLRTPDAALGLASYALTLVLAGMGGADRSRRRPWVPLALLGQGAGRCR